MDMIAPSLPFAPRRSYTGLLEHQEGEVSGDRPGFWMKFAHSVLSGSAAGSQTVSSGNMRLNLGLDCLLLPAALFRRGLGLLVALHALAQGVHEIDDVGAFRPLFFGLDDDLLALGLLLHQ